MLTTAGGVGILSRKTMLYYLIYFLDCHPKSWNDTFLEKHCCERSDEDAGGLFSPEMVNVSNCSLEKS